MYDLILAGLRPENLCCTAIYIVRLMSCSCHALVMLFACQAVVWLIPALVRLCVRSLLIMLFTAVSDSARVWPLLC